MEVFDGDNLDFDHDATEETGGEPDVFAQKEDAGRQFRQLQKAIFDDPAHPWLNAQDPTHDDAVQEFNRLSRLATAGESRPSLGDISRGAMAKQEQDQNDRVARAHELMDEFEQLGWESEDVPEDLVGPELEVLEIFGVVLRKEWPVAEMLLQRAIEQLPMINRAAYQALQEFREATKPSQKRTAALKVLRGVRDEGRRRLGLPPRNNQTQEGDEE